ncbi:hypothetical protein B1F79_02355 [Coxiella-like endosymbiont of Rhipicephalus sanguineus]|nr:hypothetical protein [Coxiella-like endosymbiont of Rhipicephalus sanguineus]
MKQSRRYFIDRYEGGERTLLVHINISFLYKMDVVRAEKSDQKGHLCLSLEIQHKDYQQLFRNVDS